MNVPDLIMENMNYGTKVYLLFCAVILLGARIAFPQGTLHAELAMGLDVSRGNSETVNASVDFSGAWKSADNEFLADLLTVYGEAEETTTEDHTALEVQYNRLVTEKTYLYLNAKTERDRIALLDYRIIAGPGIGLYPFRNRNQLLKIELGCSFVREKNRPGEQEEETPETEDHASLRATEKYEVKGKNGKVWQSLEYIPVTDDPDSFLMNAEIGLENSLTGTLSLRIVLGRRYDSNPAEGRDKNDISLRTSLVFRLAQPGN